MKNALFAYMDELDEIFNDMALKIWEHPQVAMEETFAVKLQSDFLKKEGFAIQSKVGGIDTAFIAEYGEGKPIIGILGEYDALPGLSQKITSSREPVEVDAPGHGCGHNLLGTAGVKVALAISKMIKDKNFSGTIRYYGCPAEETLSGKVLMARDGVFNDLDAALTWHPMNVTGVWRAGALAMTSMKFKFKGKSAHAAAQPDAGRSALDAVELMNVGANYLREHIVDSARVHYTITNGGLAPNIVPADAESWYYIRAPKRYMVEEIVKRLEKVASGAAMMTETKMSRETITGCYDFLANSQLSDVMAKNMLALDGIKYSEDALKFAKEIRATLSEEEIEASLRSQCAPSELKNMIVHEGVIESIGGNSTVAGSTDVGDVSWIVPTAQLLVAAWPIGVAAHSWQSAAVSGSSIGLCAMNFAAKVIAGTAVDLYLEPKGILGQARNEFYESTENRTYQSPLSEKV